jgi:hypothetical protein
MLAVTSYARSPTGHMSCPPVSRRFLGVLLYSESLCFVSSCVLPFPSWFRECAICPADFSPTLNTRPYPRHSARTAIRSTSSLNDQRSGSKREESRFNCHHCWNRRLIPPE